MGPPGPGEKMQKHGIRVYNPDRQANRWISDAALWGRDMAGQQLMEVSGTRITLETLRQMRAQKRPIAMLTCYDYPTAQILAAVGTPLLLVGDSAAMAVLGEASTLHITLDYLLTITRAVRRGAPQAFVMGDMPYGSYPDVPTALANATRFFQEAGVDAVKLECTASDEAIVTALSAAGLVVCAHVGLLPQRAALHGQGYKAQGRTKSEADEIIATAVQLHRAGAQMLLVEAVPDEVSAALSRQVDCPLLGCGGGPSCDGHVVVLHDMLGFTARAPRFVDKLGDVPQALRAAAEQYLQQVQQHAYPAPRHQYHMKSE